jgi:hypothetical protein
MRDIIKLLELNSIPLNESEGLTNRKPGTMFLNPQGEKAFFKHLAFFPKDGGAFTAEELPEMIASIEQQIGHPIQFTNVMKQGGFGVAEFELENGKSLYTGRYFKNINLPYSKNQWKNNDIAGGYALQSKSSKKESMGYGPSDVLTQLDSQTPEQIVKQIKAKFPDGPMAIATDFVMSGAKSFTIPGEGVHFEAFRDYFCEILHPLAMASGAYNGNAHEAEEIFFKGSSFSDATISFSSSKTNGLYDSLMEQGGRKIKLSSKGDGGAAASVSNLSEAVDILRRAGKSGKMLDQYKKTIQIIDEIRQASAEDGPLIVGVTLKVITQEESEYIRGLKNVGGNVHYLDYEKQVQGGKIKFPTKNLLDIWNSVGVKVPDKATPFYKMLAGLAKRVGEKVNKETDFGSAASSILNHSALVQVDTRATLLADGSIRVDAFNTKYPSDVVSDVAMLPGDTYMSHRVHGRFSFKIYKGNAKPTPKELEGETDVAPQAPGPSAKTQAVDKKVADIGAGKSSMKLVNPSAAREKEKRKLKENLGRERR